MLRPLPNLEDERAMVKLGRMYSLRTAWLDAVHDLRDSVVRLQSLATDEAEEIAKARVVIDRLEAIVKLRA
jgi:hypothetical protein